MDKNICIRVKHGQNICIRVLNMDKTYVIESVNHGRNICIREC